MTKETYEKVDAYVKSHYRLTYGKDDTLIIQEHDKFFTVKKNETASPLILGKDIL